MTRKEEREWIVKLLFQHSFNEINVDNLDLIFEEHKLKASDFIKTSLVSIINNINKIDTIIKKHVNNKNALAIENAILRVAINEFVIQKHVPASVSINEAVEIAKKFGNIDSYKFINGVLSSIYKELI